MTLLDYKLPENGDYENSNFPCEYGGGRRQKRARTRGLDIQPNERLRATTRRFEPGKWAIYTNDADGRVFVLGTTVPVLPDSFGWIEEVDPITLERIRVSPNLETGGHNFCAGSVLLRDGHILACFGRYMHKLNLNLGPVAELELDVDHAHNGLLLLSDGMAITRNLEHNHQRKSVFTVVDPSSMTQV